MDHVLVLHIGRHKCGSSSIQYFMSSNADKLGELGVLYPEIGRGRNAHHTIAIRCRSGSFDDIDAVTALSAANPGKTVVLSSEGLGLLRQAQIEELQRRTSRQPVMIVLYTRDAAGWVPSAYNERTKKAMNLLDFDEFFVRRYSTGGAKLLSRLEPWARCFGWENIRVRSLDKRSLSGGSLIDDFLSILGFSLVTFGGANAPGLQPQNMSYGWKVLEVLRAQFGQLALYEENFELYRGHSYIRLKTAKRLRKTVTKVMAELNIDTQRTQYISAQQWNECNEIYGREVEELNAKLIGTKLPMPDAQKVTERPFLPTISEIPAAERREIARRLQDATKPRSVTGKIVAQASPAL